MIVVRWYPDERKPDNAKEAVQAIERAFGSAEAGRVDLDRVASGWHVSRAERLRVDGESAQPRLDDMRFEVEYALEAAGFVISRFVAFWVSRAETEERMPEGSKPGALTMDQESSQAGPELLEDPERIDRRAPFPGSQERRSGRRLDWPVWLSLRWRDEAGRLLREEKTVAENTSPAGARVATSMWWLSIGDIVQVEEVDQPFRSAWADIRGTYVGADGMPRLNLSFVSPFVSRAGPTD